MLGTGMWFYEKLNENDDLWTKIHRISNEFRKNHENVFIIGKQAFSLFEIRKNHPIIELLMGEDYKYG